MLKINLWNGCTNVGKKDVPRTGQQRATHLAVIVFTKDDIKGSNALNFRSYKLIHDTYLKIKLLPYRKQFVSVLQRQQNNFFKKLK